MLPKPFFLTNLKISAVGLMTEGFSIFPEISEESVMTIQGVYVYASGLLICQDILLESF